MHRKRLVLALLFTTVSAFVAIWLTPWERGPKKEAALVRYSLPSYLTPELGAAWKVCSSRVVKVKHPPEYANYPAIWYNNLALLIADSVEWAEGFEDCEVIRFQVKQNYLKWKKQQEDAEKAEAERQKLEDLKIIHKAIKG